MSRLPNQRPADRLDDYAKIDCTVTAARDGSEVTIRVALTGEVTIPLFAVTELLKDHPTYSVAEMVLDMLMPGLVAAVKAQVPVEVRGVVTGVRTFDPEMTHTLR
jgi:hypothetical protein